MGYGALCGCLVTCAALARKWPIRFLLHSRKYRANTSLSITYIRAATFWKGSKARSGYICEVVSPSLLVQIDTNRKPKHRFLLGLGEPFKPNPWDISDSEDAEKDFLMASQMAEKELPSWNHSHQISRGLLKCQLNSICFSVWSQWSSYRSEKLVEVDECVHKLKQEFTAMTEEALLFWLPKFVAEIRKSDGSLYPPNSVYQICCGLSRALTSANRVDIDMFNSPKFNQFQDACMKNLKATGQFTVQQAKTITEEIEEHLWN